MRKSEFENAPPAIDNKYPLAFWIINI